MKPASKSVIVLVAEDDALLRLASVAELEDAGYRVFEATNANQALAILESGVPIDVLFTDVNMPGGIDGVSLARLVHRRWPNVGFVVTSGRDDVNAEQLPDDGRFIPKPYLMSAVTNLIGDVARPH